MQHGGGVETKPAIVSSSTLTWHSVWISVLILVEVFLGIIHILRLWDTTHLLQ